MRFFVSSEFIFPEKSLIEIRDKKEVHHIRDVMRLKQGMCVFVFDGKEKEYSGDIKKIDRDLVAITIKEEINIKKTLPFNVTLYQAIPKKSKIDFIIEKAVELGVDTIVPMLTERTVPLINGANLLRKERWERIAKAASKQCGRVNLPIIADVITFNSALEDSTERNDSKRTLSGATPNIAPERVRNLILFAVLDKNAIPLKEILRLSTKPKNISVFIGPEGDFSDKEISMAKEKACDLCSLGNLVLRVETAAIYILSCLNYEYAS